MRVKLITKAGVPIIGTLERIEGRCDADTYEVLADGSLAPEGVNETEIFWDAQVQAVDANGERLYLDEMGRAYPLSDLVRVPVADDADDDDTPA